MAKIDHIGIAVKSLENAVPLFSALLDRNVSGREEVPAEKVKVALFGRGAGRIELLEATEADSPVGRFLERRGPGIHHLCLSVENLEEALARAREAGAQPLSPEIRTGAGGRRVAFLHPRSASGVLLELAEGARG